MCPPDDRGKVEAERMARLLAASRESLRTIPVTDLTRLVVTQSVRYGETRDGSMTELLRDAYDVAVERLTPQTRVTMLGLVADAVETGMTGVDALLPFVYGDDDHT